MGLMPQIFTAKVMHKRLFPKVNQFIYRLYYLALPLSKLDSASCQRHLAINRFGLLSFHEKDHGNHEGKNEPWIRNILAENALNDMVDEIILVCMPRVMGYVFNPISIWLCLDAEKNLIAVLSEVNNTFGEIHNYLCFHEQGRIIQENDWLEAKKLFHVSPFLKREGVYKFRFSLKQDKLGIWIEFYNQVGEKQLITSLIGDLAPLTKCSLRKVFFKYPLVTFKTIILIHWQAIKLTIKGIKYIPKPKQMKQRLSKSNVVKKKSI